MLSAMKWIYSDYAQLWPHMGFYQFHGAQGWFHVAMLLYLSLLCILLVS